MTSYAELCITTNFTFLTGASHPEELVTRAAELGLSAIAITDRNSVAGVVRAFSALKELERLRFEAEEARGTTQTSIRSRQVTNHSSRQEMRYAPLDDSSSVDPGRPLPKLIPGARIVLTDSPVEWLALPTDVAGWSRLTRLLSEGKRRSAKGECNLELTDLLNWGHGMALIALPRDPLETQQGSDEARCAGSQRHFPDNAFLAQRRIMTGAIPCGLIGSLRSDRTAGWPWSLLGMC